MAFDRNQLLQPSLSRQAPGRAPYSTQALFIASFFGGPAAAIGFGTLNAARLSRLGRDAGWIAAAVLAYLGFEYAIAATAAGQALLARADFWLGRHAESVLARGLALLVFIGWLLRHRREQHAADLLGAPRPSGWLPGLGFIVAGIVVTVLLRSLPW